MLKKKLNILYHFRVRGTGAEGVHIAGIVNGFRALGHTVHLVSPTNIDPTEKPAHTLEPRRTPSFKTVLLHRLADVLPQLFFELMEMSYNVFAIVRLWRQINRVDIDFMYERYAFFNLAGAFVAKRKKIPLILEVNELSGHKRIRGQFFVRICSSVEQYVLRQACVVITVSDFLNREVQRKVELDKTKVVTIPNGVPLNWLKQDIPEDEVVTLRKRYNLQGKKIICFVGGLVYWHNFDLLLRAVKEVHANYADVVLMIIGDGPLRQYIKEKACNLSLPSDSVVLVGNVPHRIIPMYLKMVDVAVIPETNDFRSPIKMFEYMAMGLVVVGPKKPAIEVAITHEKNGILFEPKNLHSLAHSLSRCLSEPQLIATLGEKARQDVLGNYTWEKNAVRILHLLDGSVC